MAPAGSTAAGRSCYLGGASGSGSEIASVICAVATGVVLPVKEIRVVRLILAGTQGE